MKFMMEKMEKCSLKKKGPKGLFTVHKFHQNLTNAQSGVVDCESWTDN